MFPSLSIPKPRPPNARVPVVRVIQWGFLPSKHPFPYFDVSSSFPDINMCLPQRKDLNPHLPKTKLPLCHSQAFSQKGATRWQLLFQVPLWARVLRVLTQQNEEMTTSLSVSVPLCQCLSLPTLAAHPRWCRGFSQEGTAEAHQGWPEEKSLEHGVTVTPTKWWQEFWVQHTNFVVSHQLRDFISASVTLLHF